MQASAEGRGEKTEATTRLLWFEVENFRLFQQTRLELHPEVTVLVGLNDTGKSTLLVLPFKLVDGHQVTLVDGHQVQCRDASVQ